MPRNPLLGGTWRAGGGYQEPWPERDSYGGPGGDLGGPVNGQWTWHGNADSQFANRNSIDPTTGMPIGPDPLPPAGSALQWQAEHDRQVWEYRQNLGRSALNFGQGALGLLQSFRPGGGAAIESGIYQNLASIQLQRAAMTQPLDLLGDWRRDQTARARQRANRDAERQLGVQIAGTIAGVAAAAFTGGAALPAVAAGLGALAGSQYAGSSQDRRDAHQPVGPNSPGQVPPATGKPPQGPSLPGGGGGTVGAPMSGPPMLGPQAGGGGAPSAAAPATLKSEGQQQGQQPGGGQQAQQPGAGGAAGGMAAAPVGMDGNFTPTAYAANNVAQLQHPIQHLAVARAAVAMVEGDPFFQTLTFAVNNRWRQRLAG